MLLIFINQNILKYLTKYFNIKMNKIYRDYKKGKMKIKKEMNIFRIIKNIREFKELKYILNQKNEIKKRLNN